MSAARYFVSGKVQGVWFRASAREQALALGLRGYARNLADGRVEVLAVGDATALAQLETWLRRGPANARVDDVRREDADASEAGEGFVCG
ncbi:acylphosphatase [Lysobacter sp. 5GHs7-4]|uniref:acylphosphatase n=1 Tax=Lysobacter sp. 5GHs7-4 TaxID=2904253 RepID=UPI001E4BBEDE|nr:acylphosphatase [Lysobacter sp. 5GHs7-4]UHQ24336.1 acylphosphatase [Lysobacter sp. 5GHs7-4]